MPTDGIVKKTAQEVTRGAKSDYDKAKAIYEWIRRQHLRDPQTRAAASGHQDDARDRQPRGQVRRPECALRGLARASGLPARDVYGVRVANRSSATGAWRGHGEHHARPALPGGGLSRRIRLVRSIRRT